MKSKTTPRIKIQSAQPLRVVASFWWDKNSIRHQSLTTPNKNPMLSYLKENDVIHLQIKKNDYIHPHTKKDSGKTTILTDKNMSKTTSHIRRNKKSHPEQSSRVYLKIRDFQYPKNNCFCGFFKPQLGKMIYRTRGTGYESQLSNQRFLVRRNSEH